VNNGGRFGELRRAWVNLDLAWTGAVVITALALARFS